MIGISSKSAGILVLPIGGTAEYAVLDMVGGEEQDPVEAQYLYSAAQDWEEIEGTDADVLLETATREYWLARTVSLLRLAIGGLEKPLEKRVLEHVEELFGSRVSSEKALDRLLVAPLAESYSPVALAESALSQGFSAVAAILDELRELQPLIRRMTDLWLSLGEAAFNHLPEPREMMWLTLVEKCQMKNLLRAGTKDEFIGAWNTLVFRFAAPQSRSGVNALGRELSQRLFPPQKCEEKMVTGTPLEEDESARRDEEGRGVSGHEAFQRVEKQIATIAQAISQGRDAKAEKFLRELIKEQISFSGGESHAVKSLCNIAQRCADMFRMDFEAVCLEEARSLVPSDAWTLIQYGDHLKRLGNYQAALAAFDQARQFGESDVAISCTADVYSQKGDYEKAVRVYETIPNWNDKPEVLTAIADNLRKMGRMEDARNAYTELINSARQGLLEYAKCAVRAEAGIAEIAKRQGRLGDALGIYRGILNQQEINDRDRLFYRLALCNVLKLIERFDEAYSVVDKVIQEYPFAMQARFVRGSILGLMGRAREGLMDVPESNRSRSWREWLRHYYRGLLLLKLERYEDAKKNLVEELHKAIASGEERDFLRMAAALWFLRKGETHEADGILSMIPDLQDCRAQYLSLVLKLHSATQKKDLATMNSLRERIAGLQVVDACLEKTVVALGERNFYLAVTYETEALLKLAA